MIVLLSHTNLGFLVSASFFFFLFKTPETQKRRGILGICRYSVYNRQCPLKHNFKQNQTTTLYSVKSPFHLEWQPADFPPSVAHGCPSLTYFDSILLIYSTSAWLWLPFHTHCLLFLNHKKNWSCRINWFCFGGSFAHLSMLYRGLYPVCSPSSTVLIGWRAGIGQR